MAFRTSDSVGLQVNVLRVHLRRDKGQGQIRTSEGQGDVL